MLEARRIDADLHRDSFGHGNPQIGQEDKMFYQALAVDRVIEEQFGLGLVGSQVGIHEAHLNGDPQWLRGIQFSDDGIDQGDEVFVSSLHEAVGNIREQATKGLSSLMLGICAKLTKRAFRPIV